MLTTAYIKEFLANDFDLIGICAAATPHGLSNFHSWLDSGYAGEMDYLSDRRSAYEHPKHVMENVRSIIMLGSKYARPRHDLDTAAKPVGRIARYARSKSDYHDVIHKRLKTAKRNFQSIEPDALFRGVVDTAPLLEREFARYMGVDYCLACASGGYALHIAMRAFGVQNGEPVEYGQTLIVIDQRQSD